MTYLSPMLTVDGSLHDLVMKWRTAEQGFEIVEIR